MILAPLILIQITTPYSYYSYYLILKYIFFSLFLLSYLKVYYIVYNGIQICNRKTISGIETHLPKGETNTPTLLIETKPK